MSQSSVAECPICAKSYPMSSINQHVEDCLTTSETSGKDPRENATISTQIETQKKADVRKSSFFSPGKKSKDLETNSQAKTIEKCSPKLQKRDLSNMAGKSDTSPPGKRTKLESKNSSSTFFQKTKENKNILSGNLPIHKKMRVIDIPKSLTEPPSKLRRESAMDDFVPLAEKMRPCSLHDYVGQSKILGNGSLLRSLLEANEVPSMILWGPPGCGKTSLAHIIANNAKKSGHSRFVTLSATASGINEVKEVIKVAKNEQKMSKRKTILFMDEIHRFNKSQQDTFLPHVENGTITLIGATTENPSFQLNTALLSRCRVIVLEKLSTEALQMILLRAVKSMGCVMEDESLNGDDTLEQGSGAQVVIEKDAIIALVNFCDGDARAALNGLQLAVQSQIAKAQQNITKQTNGLTSDAETGKEDTKLHKDCITVNVSHIKEGLQRTHILYDKKGEEHYNIISALHKSIRGSDANASLYWLARMLAGGEDPLYVARRLVRMASEDIGLADPEALTQTVAAYQACHFIGMPECDVILAQAAVYLARAPKSIEVYRAYNNAKKCVKEWEGPHPSVPLHIRNAPTKMMKNLGYGAGYKYNPDYDEPVEQSYLPPELENVNFF
ncbi:ATPase WRNIP1-like [Actinia tenebrosa]|uniref:ATPase WRNIP1-like n=1 Tax=Actinia tenebrosa TaxID=6105 RepID=A0A6P8HSW6_ACTTE|nr:ATPase WRNIP1-like [Actinia tenebrosa]